MKKLIAAMLILSAVTSWADSETYCYPDSMGRIHCTTHDTGSRGISPPRL